MNAALIVLVSLFLLAVAGLLVWAWWWPLGELDPNQYGADDAHPVLKEFPHE